jgi:hypothetical protein
MKTGCNATNDSWIIIASWPKASEFCGPFDHLIGAGKKWQLIAMLLTEGETDDCTIAERLIRRVNHRNA